MPPKKPSPSVLSMNLLLMKKVAAHAQNSLAVKERQNQASNAEDTESDFTDSDSDADIQDSENCVQYTTDPNPILLNDNRKHSENYETMDPNPIPLNDNRKNSENYENPLICVRKHISSDEDDDEDDYASADDQRNSFDSQYAEEYIPSTRLEMNIPTVPVAINIPVPPPLPQSVQQYHQQENSGGSVADLIHEIKNFQGFRKQRYVPKNQKYRTTSNTPKTLTRSPSDLVHEALKNRFAQMRPQIEDSDEDVEQFV